MRQEDVDFLLQFFKTMADENRLRMVILLNSAERSVGELAELLELTEPTVSHHLSRMREAGLVSLRAAGNQRFYRLDHAAFKKLSQKTLELESAQFEADEPASDESWIDALELSEEDKDVLRHHTRNQVLVSLPSTRHRDKIHAVLRWLASHFEADRTYKEREVNSIIGQYHSDYSSLRRELVEFGYLGRERDGSRYWLLSYHPDVSAVDIEET